MTLPEFYNQVFSLNQIIDVDFYLPGCPPPADLIANAVFSVLEGSLPSKGSTLAPRKALCDTCDRNKTKPTKIMLKEIKRIHEVEADPSICFLAQGILCYGPAIRSGCGAVCINTNIPCRGCFGPVKGVADYRAKFLSALASMLDVEDDKEMRELIGSIDDLAGYLYRFSVPVSPLVKKRV